ncbi:MAG TPA: RDD family protein [Pyrinomonadaceae bacterium]|jgi:uncharacterized RDD family membrane protein YckC|nr:RDD family protein [Pyrinomonadaceae bacterium]
MECPFCYTNFEYRLSICPHCGKATDDPIYQELFSRVKPRKISDKIEETVSASLPEVPPVTGEMVASIAAAPGFEAPAAMPAILAEAVREKPAITTEIRSKNTCNTLVDFPGKKPELPEWRLELQSRLKEIKDQRGQAAAANSEAIVAKKHAIGGTGLAMALLEEPQVSRHPPLIEKALRRIEESRQKYEPQEQAPARTYQPRQTPSYTPVPTAPTRPAALYRREPTFAEGLLNPVTPADDDTGEIRPFIFSENETVEDRLSQIGRNHREKLARAAEIKNDLLASGEKFDTNRLRKFQATVSYPEGDETVTTPVKYRTETAAPKFMLPREEEAAEKAQPESVPPTPVVNFEEDEREEIAPFAFRFNAGLFDFIISGFLSLLILSPFVMLGGNWFTVEGAFAFLVTCSIVMFLYITAAVGLIGRTLGMGLFSLEMIDAEDNDYPTFNQAAVSSCVYLLTLALGGIGFAAIFWNPERRAVHDLISGTMVVREN